MYDRRESNALEYCDAPCTADNSAESFSTSASTFASVASDMLLVEPSPSQNGGRGG
jgi:hypothetical protein